MQAQPDREALKVIKVIQVRRDCKVYKDLKVIKVTLDCKALKVTHSPIPTLQRSNWLR